MRTFFKQAVKQMSLYKQQSPEINDVTMQAVVHAIASVQQLGFGSIEVTVHEGRITQIEKREKLRVAQHKFEKK